MGRAYSIDLRTRVIQAHEAGEGGYGTLARQFRVSPNTIYLWVRTFRHEGRCCPKHYRHGFLSVLDEDDGAVLRQLVEEQNDATLAEYAERFTARTGYEISPSSVGRALKRLKLFRKKKTLRASEQKRPDVAAERTAFEQAMPQMETRRLVFIDETGVRTNMTRSYARAYRQQRAFGSAPFRYEKVTVLGALGLEGVAGEMMPSKAATTIEVFTRYLKDDLLPFLKEHKPDAIIVMDNLSVHHNKGVKKTIEDAGFPIQYLPRYSPALSPLEECWSKIKEHLRAAAARTTEAVVGALRQALETITPQDIRGWFKHSGYPIPSWEALPTATR